MMKKVTSVAKTDLTSPISQAKRVELSKPASHVLPRTGCPHSAAGLQDQLPIFFRMYSHGRLKDGKH